MSIEVDLGLLTALATTGTELSVPRAAMELATTTAEPLLVEEQVLLAVHLPVVPMVEAAIC